MSTNKDTVLEKDRIITQWVHQHTDQLYAYAIQQVKDPSTASDLVQEVFVTAFEKFAQFRQESQANTWLQAILRNKVIDHHRKTVRNVVHTESSLGTSNHLEGIFQSSDRWAEEHRPHEWDHSTSATSDMESFLEKCMDNIPEGWRSAIHMKFILQKKGTLICQELDLTPSNYWQILHRAKISLRECLERSMDQNDLSS